MELIQSKLNLRKDKFAEDCSASEPITVAESDSTRPCIREDGPAMRNAEVANRDRELESFGSPQLEPSTSQLQIDLLQSATALFNARLDHAMQEVERLRILLADRSMPPVEFKALQHQRLVQERWLLSAQGLSGRLDELTAQPPSNNPTGRPDSDALLNSHSELDANLADYRQRLQDKALTKSHTPQRTPRNQTVTQPTSPPRSRHNGLLVLNLASRYPPPPRYRKPPPSHSLPPSMDVQDRSEVLLAPIESLPTPPSSPNGRGTAKIWRSSMVRPKDQIIADIVVAMPDYVNDLLAGLDSAVPDSSPELQDPFASPLKPAKRASVPAMPTTSLKPKSSRTSFKLPRLPPRSETPSSPPSRPTTPHLPATPSRKRLSALLAFPEALSSRISLRTSTDLGNNNMSHSNSRTGWRMSSPPSSFPSALFQEGNTNVGPVGLPASPTPKGSLGSQRSLSYNRRPSVSISDLRSSAKGSSPVVPSSSIKVVAAAETEVLQPQLSPSEPKGSNEGKLLSKLRHRMSALRRF
ncbi:hypothetical protein CPB83DRAFT_890880 [Crepidotus variabilis]|uniref:Uncharacterized protein n=1 Tax=Crepidotus variabilis TaxID=179855 RepID=A0A9P6JT47_9AGAR|nr:hypothetical protein CPB83DRAFT_890880 [Crepidotus variabilis]